MMPKVQALHSLGGKALAKDVYPVVTKAFPQLTPGDIAEPLPSGGNKWTNRMQWARQRLVERGETVPKRTSPSPIRESAASEF